MRSTPKRFNIVGQKYSTFIVLEQDLNTINKEESFYRKCLTCGDIQSVTYTNIRRGLKGTNIRCKNCEAAESELIGRQFDRLTVRRLIRSGTKTKSRLYECLCECGEITIVNSRDLLSRNTCSCGCLRKDRLLGNSLSKKHGMSQKRMYMIWACLRQRCDNPMETGYCNYGGRGITYDPTWNSFENFYKDMKDGYADNLTIERIDVNGNYTKDNCKWATRYEQSQNKRNVYKITVDGEIRSVSEWARLIHKNYSYMMYCYHHKGEQSVADFVRKYKDIN